MNERVPLGHPGVPVVSGSARPQCAPVGCPGDRSQAGIQESGVQEKMPGLEAATGVETSEADGKPKVDAASSRTARAMVPA
ncbi:MAG: hypothetical protein U0075_26740 [Thermomicrobiales bacterium]